MKPSGRPALAAFKRLYSAQAQAARRGEKRNILSEEAKLSKLSNGVILASMENHFPVAQVAVLYNAGPRYEPGGQCGITHCLRNAFSLSTKSSTSFGITRSIQQIGGNIGCTSTREQMIYTLECLRDETDTGLKILGDITSRPAFMPWELDAAKSRLKFDYSAFMDNLEARLMEALHQAAFRGGLENSLYCPEHKIGFHTPEMLQEYVAKYYTSGNMAIVGLGVSHEQLTVCAKQMTIQNQAAPPVPKSKFIGEQLRVDANTDLVYAAVATEGVGLGSADLLKVYVLQKVMGSGPFVKYSNNIAGSKVAKAAAKGTNAPFAATCFNAAYSDTGLFGYQVIAQAGDAEKVIKSIRDTFAEATKGGITDADVQRAKNQLKAALLMELESSRNFLLDFGLQAILSGQVLSIDEVTAAVDKITTADVQNIAKKVINGKPTMAAVGNLSNTPHVDELMQ